MKINGFGIVGIVFPLKTLEEVSTRKCLGYGCVSDTTKKIFILVLLLKFQVYIFHHCLAPGVKEVSSIKSQDI